MPEAEIAATLRLDEDGEDDENAFELWPENEHALKCFMAVRRMWRYGVLGGVLGLDRPNVESELRMRKIKLTAELLDDLAAMEAGAMEVLNAR